MNLEKVKEILSEIKNAKIAVYGDFCLDLYWMLDPAGSEVSVETGLKGMAVRKQNCYPGGAANVVANLAVLGPRWIFPIGVVGDDLFGHELLRQFRARDLELSGLFIQQQDYHTITFCKPILDGVEQPRIDIGIANRKVQETENFIFRALQRAMEEADVLVVNQQFPASITDESFVERMKLLFQAYPEKIVLLDSRHYGHFFNNVYRKINEAEAARLNDITEIAANPSRSVVIQWVQNLYAQTQKPVFVTRGSRGIVVFDQKGLHEVPGIQLLTKIDPVGAGDTILSALACCLAIHISPFEAAEFANLAAAVTVQKLYQTGTASPAEICQVATNLNYLFQPDLANDGQQARYLPNTEIEVCAYPTSLVAGAIRHVVFDHDGTISTLREGWEPVMSKMMIAAILGNKADCVGDRLKNEIRQRVLAYVEKSTGIETIVQMEALVEMVREFGLVPEVEVKDAFAYKCFYYDLLDQTSNYRKNRVKSHELDAGDFTIKGAIPFLKALRGRGITIYLTSGSDHADVIEEARLLGYAELFNGGIFGALDRTQAHSKKQIVENIFREHQLQGSELACFGDGPVEMRACRKFGGIAVGVASDEVRRFGLNLSKRARLIMAGAQLIIPDFSQLDQLLQLLFTN